MIYNTTIFALITLAAAAPSSGDHVRYLAAPGAEADLVGGRFEGSNTSPYAGFQLLVEIKTAPPAGGWGELPLENAKFYRWIRYVAPPGSKGRVAEIEWYAGKQRLNVGAFGPIVEEAGRNPLRAWDRKSETYFEAGPGDEAVIGGDLREYATAVRPKLKPEPGNFDGPLDVEVLSATPDAVIRYTLDGSMPSRDHGKIYAGPIHIEQNATIQAVAYLAGRAPSPPTAGVYLLKAESKPGLKTFHLGNSLTQTTSQFALYATTAGRPHESRLFTRPGAWTKELWDVGLKDEKQRWEELWNSLDRVDHLTLQPRDFDIAEEAGYDRKFIDLFRTKSPNVQPWLYCEWVEKKRQRPTDRGEVPSRQMKTLYPALTWEESMSAMLLYVEDLRETVLETETKGKRPRVLPSALAMGWIKNMIDADRIPGLAPGSFYPTFFKDQVHPSVSPLNSEQGNGGYLVDLTWYAAFYGESPEDQVLPVGTTFNAEQTRILQRLAWSIIENYPDCGVYREGSEPVAPPKFEVGPMEQNGAARVTLTSSTPGAWFRYTLDGSEPTRTRGYVYCGVISARPGMKVRAVAYRSGMADSEVGEITASGTRADQ